MKRFTILFSAVLCFGTSLVSQNWTSINSGITTTLSSGTYLDELNLFATGFDGSIYSSADGGLTWGTSFQGGMSLNSIACNNNNVLVAVGFAGYIVRYDGTSWQTIPSGTSFALSAVCFADANTAFAVGENGTILKSTDAGLTWGSLNSRSTDWLTGVNAFDASNVAAVSENGTLLQSSNGGSSWTQTFVPGLPWLGAVAMMGPNTGWISGTEGVLFAFLAGALTPYPTGTLDGLVAMMLVKILVNQWVGYAAGDFGHIFAYANGTWVDQGSQSSKHILGLMLLTLMLNDDGVAADSVEVRACAVGMDGLVLLNSEIITASGEGDAIDPEISLYPNPTSGTCYLTGNIPKEGIDLKFTDLTGKEVHAQRIMHSQTPLDLRHLNNGLYIVHGRNGVKILKEKILVHRD